jgi:hypothetical protein
MRGTQVVHITEHDHPAPVFIDTCLCLTTVCPPQLLCCTQWVNFRQQKYLMRVQHEAEQMSKLTQS